MKSILNSQIAQRARGSGESFPEAARKTPPAKTTTLLKPKSFKTKKITPNRKPLYPARLTSATATPPRVKTLKKNSFKTGSQAVLAIKNNNNKGRAGLGGFAVVPVPVSGGKSDSESGSDDKSSRNSTARSRPAENRTGKTGSRFENRFFKKTV